MRISEPSEVGTVELDVFCHNGERVVLRRGRVDGDLRGLDLRDDVEWSVVGADAEGDGELAAANEGMDSKGRVTGGNEDRSFFRKPSRSEVGSSFDVSVDDDEGAGSLRTGRSPRREGAGCGRRRRSCSTIRTCSGGF